MMTRRFCATRKRCSKKLDTQFLRQRRGYKHSDLRQRAPRLRDARNERTRGCPQIKLVRPELMVILLSGSDVPTNALAFVHAFIPKLEANRQLLPMIVGLCGQTM